MILLKYSLRIFGFACLLVLALACNNTKPGGEGYRSEIQAEDEKQPMVPVFSSYKAAIEAMRKDKDAAMVSKQTIEPENIKDFKGLQYYEPDSTFILKATFELLKPEKVIFKTTDERAPEYYKFCKLSFTHNNEKGVLIGYVDNINSPESIFIPFRDATSNKETYGGGRYMDLQYNGERTMILLDFNYAYNPYCHYNHNYSCPLVPEENVLKMAITAGEKKLYE